MTVLSRARGQASGGTDAWTLFVYAAIFAAVALAFSYQAHSLFGKLIELADQHRTVKWFLYPSILWTAMGAALLIFRTGVWISYRPFPAARFQDAPLMTVVIPAYNEGRMVLKSIEAVAGANYPRDRLEIVVIDDGSKDDTWHWISEAASRYPGLVTPIRQDRNRGKREALTLGFARAKGEILVTIDSDSVIEPDALLALAGPFANPRIGAVAGKVLVYNRHKGLIPRMLHVRYVLSFDFLRSVESVYRNVFCCPGALTGLRASAVRGVLERWQNQHFLGSRCTFGEDRAMTNFLLDAGYDTVYQRAAVVHTEVPERYKKLCKMLLRWDRSYVREELRFARIVWKRPLVTRAIALVDRLITNLRYPVMYASLFLLVQLAVSDPHAIVRIATAIGMMALLNVLYFLRSEKSFEFLWGVAYAYFAMFALFWIFPYAVCTVRKRAWLTR